MNAWTKDRIEQMTRMAADRCSAREIAGALGGITRNAIIGKMYRLCRADASIAGLRPLPAPRIAASKPRKPGKPALRAPGHRFSRHPPAPASARPKPTEEPVPEPTSLHLSVMDLEWDTCRFPHGDPLRKDFHFCGATAWRPGSSWCSFHRRIVYRPADDRRAELRRMDAGA